MSEATTKSILVVAHHDTAEAMRVAAGLTIFDHQVSIVIANGPLEITDQIVEQAELLSISEVEVRSLCADPEVPRITDTDFSQLLLESDFVATI